MARRGFRVTVAGGTSILPVSGYVLYDFMPVEEMFNVAEAVVRVFHRFGDYEHRSRNRLKFTIKSLGWDGFRARYRRGARRIHARRRRAAAVRSVRPPRPEQAPGLGACRTADASGGGRRGEHAGERSGHPAGHGSPAAAARQLSCAGCAAT